MRGIGIVDRLRRRRRTHAAAVEEASDDPLPALDEIAKDIEMAISQRRRRLNSKLGTSLKSFKLEVLDEVSEQAEAAKDRRSRLRDRQRAISESLDALRHDLNDEIEDVLAGVKLGGERLDRALKNMRSTWESEVSDLIAEAETEIDLAIVEIEDAISSRREEWAKSVRGFEDQWLASDRRNASRLNGTALRLFSASELSTNLASLQERLDAASAEVEDDLQLFKRRWETTTQKVEALPSELPKLKSLADIRMYVDDTIFAGDVPALLTRKRRGRRQSPDPLGLREGEEDSSAAEVSSPVLRPTAASNLRLSNRQIAIVTTAALPWMTGTSINPLLRAAYLSAAGHNVTLLLPWIPLNQQAQLFPEGLSFARPKLQEQYVRWWCENRANVRAPDLRLRWYPATYSPVLGCIIQNTDDITRCIPEPERDAVILEEPEHLNWYHHGRRWTDEFRHVVGIAHTNYLQYARYNTEGVVQSGELKAWWTEMMNNMVCSAHTDLVVKLSATLPDVPGTNLVCNVHGVRSEFLAIGGAAAERARAQAADGAYFLGKAMFTKGYRELIEALELSDDGHALPHVETYGSGPDFEKICERIERQQLPISPNPGIDHAHPTIHRYRVFVNPSTSDVLCTATAEALAMNKKVIIPDHPSNAFFKQFSNCIMYDDPSALVPLLREALASEPTPMSTREQYRLSWDAASERLLDAAALPMGTTRARESPFSTFCYYAHYAMGVQPVFDVFRTITGAPNVEPWGERLASWQTLGRIPDRRAETTEELFEREDALELERKRLAAELGGSPEGS